MRPTIPAKAHPPLLAYTYRVLAFAVTLECLQPVTWGDREIGQTVSLFEVVQLRECPRLNTGREFLQETAAGNLRCLSVFKRPYHLMILSTYDNIVKGCPASPHPVHRAA